jgi:hypothetical protein
LTEKGNAPAAARALIESTPQVGRVNFTPSLQ